MSFYLSIDAQQLPFAIIPSPTGRAMYSCNYLCEVEGVLSSGITSELLSHLNGQLGLVENTNLFAGLLAVFPNEDGPFVRVGTTSGIAPDHQHNSSISKPAFQILVEGKEDAATETLAYQVFEYLTNTTNTTIT